MTIRTRLACWAAVAVIAHAAAGEPQEKEPQKPLEQPPAFSEGARSGSAETQRATSREQPPSSSEDSGNDEELEPTITIKQQDDVTVYEYRLNGLLYKIKVVPKNAPAYYLVDTDGDGFMEWRRNYLASPDVNRIPAWVFFRW